MLFANRSISANHNIAVNQNITVNQNKEGVSGVNQYLIDWNMAGLHVLMVVAALNPH